MTVTIELSPEQEKRLEQAAHEEGVEPTELVKKLIAQHLTANSATAEVRAKLREWQARDGTRLAPAVPASVLFARWRAQDAEMTDSERDAEDELWHEFERGINETRGVLGMRRLS